MAEKCFKIVLRAFSEKCLFFGQSDAVRGEGCSHGPLSSGFSPLATRLGYQIFTARTNLGRRVADVVSEHFSSQWGTKNPSVSKKSRILFLPSAWSLNAKSSKYANTIPDILWHSSSFQMNENPKSVMEPNSEMTGNDKGAICIDVVKAIAVGNPSAENQRFRRRYGG